MKTKRLISILLSIVLLFSSLSAVFYSTSFAMAESQGDSNELVDAVYVGKSGTESPIMANIFFPLTVNKASPDAEETFYEHNQVNDNNNKVMFRFTAKVKMLSGGVYVNPNTGAVTEGLGPVVGFVSYDYSAKAAAPSRDAVNMRPVPVKRALPPGSSYTYDAETGELEVIFRPDIKADSEDNGGVYGAITVGNCEHGPANDSTDIITESDYDISFIISEPELYAYSNETKDVYGNNLLQDADGNAVGFGEDDVDFSGSYRTDGKNYKAVDTLLSPALRYKWHIDMGDSLIKKVKVPANYATSSDYASSNFEKHNETEYIREYYTNSKYPGKNFICQKNSEGGAFTVIDDVHKKMIVLSANNEGMPEGSYGDNYSNSNRYANLSIAINTNQYYRSLISPDAPAARGFLKVTMTAKRLSGDGAPVLGRFYGESNAAKASNGTSYAKNFGSSGTGDEAALPPATYNPDTGEFVGYVRTYFNAGDEKTKYGHSEWLTIGNGEHKGSDDMFWDTAFNSSFAITDIKVDVYSYNSSNSTNALGNLLAEDVAPGLFEETVDNENPRCYRANSRAGVSFDQYDITAATQEKWAVDGAIDLVHTYDVTTCVAHDHYKAMVETPISDTTLDSWYCPICNSYYEDNIGLNKIGTKEEVESGNLLDLSRKMVHIQGTNNSPAYLAIPLKLAGFTGHAYFKFSCTFKNLGNNDPIIRIYEARREGQKGGATPDSTAVPIAQEFDPDTMTLNVLLDVWRPGKSSYAPFFYTEPDTGANFLMLIGNSELVGAGYNAVNADFTFTDPKIVRMKGDTLKSGEMTDAVNVTMAPISDKTVEIDSSYALGKYENNWYYADENSPLTAKLNRWYDIGGNITVEDIPDKYFQTPHGIEINNMNGTVSSFQTVESGKTYSFYYDGAFESFDVPKPFVEFISSTGASSRKYLIYQRDTNGRHNFTATFTAPTGLRDTRNIRIGIDVDSTDIKGRVANFSLTEVSGESDGSNLMVNGSLIDTTDLIEYSLDAEAGVWMYQGSLGDSKVGDVMASLYIIPVPYLATFIGSNEGTAEAKTANDGRPNHGYISQNFTVEKGRKYRVSFNVKYVSKGYEQYGSKVGAEFSYVSTSGTKSLGVPVVESDEEYRETYEFTMPDDTAIAAENLTFTFNFWGAFVSGHIANFTMYEIDDAGERISTNMFTLGEFAEGTCTPGWTKSSSNEYYKFDFSQIPENFFSKVNPVEARMLHFKNTDDWSWFAYSPMLKPDTNYEWYTDRVYTKYDSDKKPSTSSSMFKPSNTGMATEDFYSITRTDTFESKKFRTSSAVRLYGNNNMILRYYMMLKSEGYLANLQLYELDEDGNRVSDNLFINGDFALDYTCFDLSETDMSDNRFEEIPEDLFYLPSMINIKNTKAKISSFSTVESGKVYTFYYDGKFDSDEVPKPFAEFVSSTGTTTLKYLDYTRDVDGKYCFKATFTAPAGLRASKNIRIGIDVHSKDIEGSVANFYLKEVSGDSFGENLLKNGDLMDLEDLKPYSTGVDEGVWTFEGDLGDTEVDYLSKALFKITTPNLLTFVGINTSDSKATQSYISQQFTLQKGKKYRISYNVKYVNKGYSQYGSKAGAELTYLSESGTKSLVMDPEESDTEYRETYEFTTPDDMRAAVNNFKFTFNYWGSFVYGHCANFTLFEIDNEGNPVGKNMFAMGDFPDAEYSPSWTKTGATFYFRFSEIPENYFSKTNPTKARMIHFKNTDDWSWFAYSPMLKPDTNYEWCGNLYYTKYDSDKKPSSSSSMFKPNAEGAITNTGMGTEDFYSIESYEKFESKKFRTDAKIRMYGGNNMILRYYMRKNSEGYIANLGLYELDDNGNRVSGNLFIDGDFGLATMGDNGPQFLCYDLSNTKMASNTLEEIPDGFFDMPSQLTIKDTNAKISSFTTVESGKTYIFKYDGRFESESVPKPFVEFVSSNGTTKREYLQYSRDVDGRYCFKSTLTAPEGLRASKNLRIGIDVDSTDIDGVVANFSLIELSSESTEENLLKDGKFVTTLQLTLYSPDVAEGVWTYEGQLGDVNIDYIDTLSDLNFKITTPNMLSFIGVNENTAAAQAANDGRPLEGKIYQKFTIEAGKKYRISYNVKYVTKGYEQYQSKVGSEITFINSVDNENKLNITPVESDEEYRETYEFTTPGNIKVAPNNLTYTFYYCGAFVSGHVANFTMYEIDADGNPVGKNMFTQGDFPEATYAPGWTKSGSSYIFQFSEIPEGYFSKTNPYKARMVYFEKTADWDFFSFSPMLKPDTNYEWCYNRLYTKYDSDKKPSSSSAMFRPQNTEMSVNDFYEIKSYDTFESKKFRTDPNARLYGGNNMILRYYMRQNSTGYYANLQLYELDEDGNRVSDNLYINGDFGAEYNCFELKQDSVRKTTQFMDIPDGFFDASTEIEIKNSESTISTFATVGSKKTYSLTFDGQFESEDVPKPFVEFIAPDGTTTRKYLQYDRNIDGGYNFQSAFTTPAGLRSDKNIRIGIDIDSKNIIGRVANFVLTEISGESSGENLIKNGKLVNVEKLVPYSDDVEEGIWMYEGDLGDTIVGAPIAEEYKQPVSNMIMFRGKNQNDKAAETANDGRPCQAALTQFFTLVPNHKYRISFNVKYVSKGYEEFGSKCGAELTYYNSNKEYIAVPTAMTESDTEYRETYEFTLPNDATNNDKGRNFKFAFNYWGAFVSGYISNFTLYEIDEGGNEISDNMFIQGDFPNNTYYPGWDNSAYTNWTTFQYVPVPEDFFKKNGNYRPKMIYFHGQEDWAWFSLSPMLKPDTNYELTFGRIITDQDSSKISYQSDSMFYPNIEGVMTNTSMDSSYFTTDVTTETSQTRIFRTKPDVRLYGGNNMILRWYMREASAGYYGNIELYELDDAGKRVGNNLFLNWDFVAGFKANETYGVVDTWRFVEIPDGFFKAKESYSQMVTSKGTSANANYIVKATVNRFKKQFLEFRYVGMNSSGVTPIVQYPAYDESGNVVYRSVPISSFYDSNRYYYEATFTLPADAISKDGMTDIQILFNNGNKGKGYFTNIKVVEDGKYVNQVTSAAADKSGNFETVAYDSSVFVFYYDDTKFDDGDWSGERSANAYNIPTGNVTGVVLDENFSPVVGARIRLQPGNLTTTTDSTGAYLFEGLNPGNYKLYLETAGVSLFCMDITVEKGMTYNAPSIIFKANGDAVIDSGITDNSGSGGEIVGIYYGRDGKPKANVRIYITKSVYAETDKNGRFEFKNIKPNTYKLYVRVGDRYYELREVTVQAQKRISIKVLEPLFEEDETFLEMIENFFYDYTLYAVLACVGAALVLGGIVFLIIFLATRKKRKAKKAAQ